MIFAHPLQGCLLRKLLKLYLSHGISIRFLPRAFFILLTSVLTTPFRFLENALYDKKIRSTVIKPPIFIIGHGRSGTTLLHNILSQDPQFSTLSFREMTFANAFLILGNVLKLYYKLLGPIKKLRDQIKIELDSPQGDEFALANMGVSSLYIGFCFPNYFHEYSKYITLSETTPAVEIENWKSQLLKLYRKKSFNSGGRIFLSKGHTYTGKIKYLLELFPDAKFIHIYRNPYLVYPSTVKATVLSIRAFTLQTISKPLDIGEVIFQNYRELMETFFAQKELIPAKNYIEIKYEDFEQNTLQGIEKIYLSLGMNNFSQMKDKFQAYIDTLKDYKKNQYQFTPELIDKIYKNWAFTIDKWGYKPDADKS